MVGIIGAMSVEIEKIQAFIQNPKEEIISGMKFISGTISGKKVVVCVCGIGKVFAGICAQTMILTYHPKAIINIGVAGTLTTDLQITDIAIANQMVQHDMDTSPIGDPVGLISGINIVEIPCDPTLVKIIEECVSELGINYVVGTITSGDQFLVDKTRKENIVELFNGIACEMEGAAIGQVCYVNNVAFSVIRAISDTADDSAHMDYPTFVEKAADNSTKVIEKVIQRI